MKGQLLGGRYQVVEVLASGGFSQTYVAEDIHRPGNPQCVVKHLLPNLANSQFLQNARRLFQAEAEILEKLGDYDQIPRLLAYFEEEQEFYLVQEFIPGRTLRAELLPDKPWTESQVNQLLQEVLEILVFVHSHGVIHRDIKPDNLICRAGDSKLVLVDFGSVKQAWTQAIATPEQTNKTPSNHTIAIGTPGYMPTEQGRGKPQPNSDIYALGMIAIQALTLKNPTQLLDESENGEIVWQHLATVSEELAAVLTKMVRYNHRNRYQSAAEALAALQQVKSQKAIVGASLSKLSVRKLNLSVNSPGQNIGAGLSKQSAVTSKNSPGQFSVPNSQSIPSPSSGYSPLTAHLATNQNTALAVENSSVKPILAPNYKPLHRIGAAVTAVLASIITISTIDWPLANTDTTREQITTLKAQGKEQCAAASDPRLKQYECQLAQAKKLAADGNFSAAIAAASKIPPTDAAFSTAKQLIAQWSNSLLQLATKQYRSGQKQQAIAKAKAIPRISPVYPQAQKAIEQWQKSKQNHAIARPTQRTIRSATQPAINRAIRPVAQTQVRTTPAKTTRPVTTSSRTTTKKPIRTIVRSSRTTKKPIRTTPKRLPTSLTKKPLRTSTKKTSASVTQRSIRIVYKRVAHSIIKRTIRQSHQRITRSRQRKIDNFAQTKRKIENIERSYRWLKKTML